MTLDQMKSRHEALLAARYAGVRTVSYEGRRVEYGSDAELSRAISDLERRIARAEGRGSRVIHPYAVKDL